MEVLTIHLIGYWGYLWCVFFLAGFAGLRLVHRFFPRLLTSYRTGDVVWFGIAAITWLGTLASLLIPLTDPFHITVVGTLAVYSFLDRRALAAFAAKHLDACGRHGKTLGWRVLMGGTLAFAIVIFAALGANGDPTAYDTLLYHAQGVRWLKEYGTVPGLANLNTRIGFNNAWMITSAFVDAGPFTFKSFHVINSFVFVFTLITFTARLAYGLGKPICMSWVFDAIMMTALLRYRFGTNSLSTDVATTMVAVYIISYFLHRFDSDSRRQDDLCWAAVVVPFAATIKLINLPLLLLPVLVFMTTKLSSRLFRDLFKGESLRQAAWYTALASLIFLPWFVRGYIQSGYLVYPLHELDLFSPDWKVPRALAINEQNWIKCWARLPHVAPEHVLGKDISFWFEHWMKRSEAAIGPLLYLVVMLLVASAIFLQSVKHHVSRSWPAFLTLIAGLLYWFFQAPDVRFAFGYITAMQMLIISLLLVAALETLAERGRLLLGTLFATSLVIFLHGALGGELRNNGNFLCQELTDYPRSKLQPYTYPSGLTVQVPASGDLCNNEPLLCSPGVDRDKYDISLRGETLKDGFRAKPIVAPH